MVLYVLCGANIWRLNVNNFSVYIEYKCVLKIRKFNKIIQN